MPNPVDVYSTDMTTDDAVTAFIEIAVQLLVESYGNDHKQIQLLDQALRERAQSAARELGATDAYSLADLTRRACALLHK